MLNIPTFKSKWLTFVRQIIEKTSELDAWQNQSQSTKARNYSFFKQGIQLEKYALQLNKYDAIVLCKFQTRNHFLPVETGRCEGKDIRDRTCALCEIADEYHYILICPFLMNKGKFF
mgnify:CR=1 FL=1